LSQAPVSSRWRSLVTQESVSTIVSLIGAAVILPLITLVISSFRVLDSSGFDTSWGLDNYKTLYTDRIIPKASVNTLLISFGSTVLATFFGVTLAWINAHQLSVAHGSNLQPDPVFPEPFVGGAWHNLASPNQVAQQLGARYLGISPHHQRR
jgi:ABC-type phosphate transport system permease subunit